jgi:hypothetical protein
MRLITILLLAGTLVCGGVIFADEQWTLHRADRAAGLGDPHALALYAELLASRPLFLDSSTLVIRRETAAYRALQAALDAHEFTRVVFFVNAILAAPDSGLENDTRALTGTLPIRHMQWATQRFDADDFEETLRQCQLMRELYVSDAPFLDRVRSVETRSQLGLAGQLLERGDSRRVLAVLGALDVDAPLPLRLQAVAHTREAVTRPVTFLAERDDLPGVFRWLAQARALLKRHPYLLSVVEQAYADTTRRLLDIPVKAQAMPDSFDDVAPAVLSASLRDAPDPTFLIGNGTGVRLLVVLRGPDRRRTVIAPGERWKVALPAGEYVQAAQIDASTRPHIGIIKIDRHTAYGQMFVLGNGDVGGIYGSPLRNDAEESGGDRSTRGRTLVDNGQDVVTGREIAGRNRP